MSRPHFRDRAVANGIFRETAYDKDMVIEAHRWPEPQGPFTYRMVDEMLDGMYMYLREFSPPIECEVLIYKKIGTPSAYLTGMGFFSFTSEEDHLRSGGPSAGSVDRNETSADLPMLSVSNSTLNASQ